MKGLISWFVRNPVASNLLVVLILVGGLFGSQDMGKEVFPAIPANFVSINMPYPGRAQRG